MLGGDIKENDRYFQEVLDTFKSLDIKLHVTEERNRH